MNHKYTNYLFIAVVSFFLFACGGGGGSGSGSGIAPIIASLTSSGSANTGETVSFTATSNGASNGVTYVWDFGDGLASDTGATVYRSYSAANTYNVTVKAIGANNLSSTQTISQVILGGASASNVVADCSGAGCASASTGNSNQYAGSGTGVWRYDNLSAVEASRDIDIQNVVAGQSVTVVFANTQTATNAPTLPQFGVLAAPSQTTQQDHRHHSHGHLLTENRKMAQGLRHLRHNATGLSAVAAQESLPRPAPTQAAAVSVGEVRTWIENGFDKISYSATAKLICPAGQLGRRVVFWVQTTAYPMQVSDANLAAYQAQFCGSTNDDGQYAKIANVIGDVWGLVPANYAAGLIEDTPAQKQDLHIVIIAPNSISWGGYFFSLNNFKQSSSQTNAHLSNEALVFFVNASQTQNYTQSVLIHELTHMVNYYQRAVLHDDSHESWLEETSALMTQDLFETGITLAGVCQGYTAIACDVKEYAKSGANINYFNWPTGTTPSLAHYNMGGAFAAFLNRRFGPALYTQLLTDCYTPTTNTSSYACLNHLIVQNGGTSFAEEFARFGASVFGRMGGTNEPSKYGFPSKSGHLNPGIGLLHSTISFNLAAFNDWWTTPLTVSIPTASVQSRFRYTSHTYLVDTVAVGKTSYVRTGVKVPGKTSMIVVVK